MHYVVEATKQSVEKFKWEAYTYQMLIIVIKTHKVKNHIFGWM